MKKFLICLAMLFMFSTIAQAAEPTPDSDYQKLTVIQKMRMPAQVEKENEETKYKGMGTYLYREDDGRAEKDAAALNKRLSQIIDMTPTTTSEQTPVKNKMLPNVAILYINNSKSTYNDEVDMSVLPNLGNSLPADKYNLVDGAIYLERLNKVGIADLSTAERADILDAFRGDDIDYIVIMEIQPFIARDKMTFFTVGKDITTAVPFKIIDVVNGRYLYNGKFTEKASGSTMVGLIGNKSISLKALNAVNTQVSSVVETRLPQTKPVILPVTPARK